LDELFDIKVDENTKPEEINVPEPRKLPTPEEKAAKRKKAIKKRLWFYGSFLAILYFAWWYQPYEFDIIPRKIPNPDPMVDPDSDHLFQRGTKVLVVTAHPDDSEFFIGGLLSKLKNTGAELHQVICTDGDKGYYLFFTNASQNRITRRQEATEASNAWNAQSLKFLGYPDRWLHNKEDVVAKVAEEIQRVKPEYILAFDGDFPPRASHQDHRRSGDIAKIAAERTHVAKWLLLFSTIAPNYVEDIGDFWEDQKKLLQIHKSQYFGKHLEGVENMIQYNAEKDGGIVGYEMGEGLRCIKLQ